MIPRYLAQLVDPRPRIVGYLKDVYRYLPESSLGREIT